MMDVISPRQFLEDAVKGNYRTGTMNAIIIADIHRAALRNTFLCLSHSLAICTNNNWVYKKGSDKGLLKPEVGAVLKDLPLFPTDVSTFVASAMKSCIPANPLLSDLRRAAEADGLPYFEYVQVICSLNRWTNQDDVGGYFRPDIRAVLLRDLHPAK